METTPTLEFWFVKDPDKDKDQVWPREEKLCGVHEHKMRKPMPIDELKAQLAAFNRKLKKLREPTLMLEEAVSARLYTGPMCVQSVQHAHAKHSDVSHTQSMPFNSRPTVQRIHIPPWPPYRRFVKYNDLLRGFGGALEGCKGNTYTTTTCAPPPPPPTDPNPPTHPTLLRT